MSRVVIDRAVVEQALETIEGLTRDRLFTAEWAGNHGATIAALRAALAQQDEPVATVAENATTQQRVVETPPSDYRRGYWDGFNIGKREGRIEEEDALAQQAEPDLSRCPKCNGPADNGHDRSIPPNPYLCTRCMAEPVEPVAWRWGYRSVTTGEMDWRGYVEIAAHPNLRSPEIIMEPLYTAPPQQAEPVEPVATLTAQRDALLEVVRKFVAWSKAERDHSGTTFWQRVEMCREVDALAHAAIKAVEEAK